MKPIEYRAVREAGGSNRFEIQRRTFLGWARITTEQGEQAAQKYLNDLVRPQILTPQPPREPGLTWIFKLNKPLMRWFGQLPVVITATMRKLRRRLCCGRTLCRALTACRSIDEAKTWAG